MAIDHTVCALVGPDVESSQDHERVATAVGLLYLGSVSSLLRSPDVWAMVSASCTPRPDDLGDRAG